MTDTQSQPIERFELGAEVVGDDYIVFDSAPDLSLPAGSWTTIRLDLTGLGTENCQAALVFQLFRSRVQAEPTFSEHAIRYDRESVFDAIRRRLSSQQKARPLDGITTVYVPRTRINDAIAAVEQADPEHLSESDGCRLAEAIVEYETARERRLSPVDSFTHSRRLDMNAPEWLLRAFASAAELETLSTLLCQLDDRVAYLDTPDNSEHPLQ